MIKTKGIKFLYVATMIYFMTMPLRNSLLLYMSRVPALLVMMLMVVNTLRVCGIRKQYFGSLIIFFATILLNMVYHGVLISFDLLLSITSVFMLLLLISCSQHFLIDRHMKKFLLKWSCVCAVVMNIYAFSPYGYRVENRISTSLTLNSGNSNLTAIYLFLLYCIILLTMPWERKKAIIPLGLEISLISLILKTKSRTVFLALLVITAYYIFFRRIKIRQGIVWGMAIFLPVLFVPIYLFLFSILPDTYVFWGKEFFTGREILFTQTSANIDGIIPLLVGNLMKNPFNNAHNGALAIVASSGIVGAISYYTITYGELLRANKSSVMGISNMAVAVLIGCYVHTCGEAALLLGGFPGITFMFIFYVLAHDTSANNRKEE